jgi:branched-chain amino acid transport system ATP-binding protein
MLEVRNLEVSYGPVRALQGLSISVPEGKLVCVIGSNGAGKTTLLRTISGLLTPRAGTVVLDGKPLLGHKAHEVTRLGVAHVPEGRHVFPDQSVYDNLLLGSFSHYAPSKRAAIAKEIEAIFDMFPRLRERRTQLAGTMSGGEQQMLAIGRALMSRPRVVLLDEPSMGLAPILIDDVFRTLGELKARGVTMLLVEQLAYRALGVADYGYVMEHGKIEIEGPAADLRADARVQAAYLGKAKRAEV